MLEKLTTMEMNICTSREYQAADRKLNSVYQALRPRLSRQQQKRMTDAQLAWIKFRDATCAYERGEFEGVQWQVLSELLA